MPTLRQKKVAKAVVDSLQEERPTAQKVLESAGYGKSLQNHPKRVLQSEGVQEELKTVYGFDEETAKNVVADILIGAEHDSDRLKAADMIFKVHGSYAAEKHANFNVNINTSESNEALEEAAKAYGAAAIKRRLS